MFALTDRDGERTEAGVFADLLRDKLIERLGVAEGGLARVRRGREEALAGMVVTVYARVREAGKCREARAVRSQQIEIGAGGGAVRGEEVLRHHPERDMDGDHPLGRGLFSGLGQRRQRQAGAGGEEEVTSVHHKGLFEAEVAEFGMTGAFRRPGEIAAAVEGLEEEFVGSQGGRLPPDHRLCGDFGRRLAVSDFEF
jgi:hypothetical protein